MNILVICEYGLYQDFSSSFVHAQAREFARLGHQVRVLVPIAWGKTMWSQGRWKAQPFFRDQVEIVPLRHLSLSNYGKGWWNHRAAYLAALRYGSRGKNRAWVPDVIHAHTVGSASYMGGCLKKQFRCPLVITTHGSDVSIPYEQGRLARLRPLCAQADAIVAVSSALAEKVRAMGAKVPVRVILNGFQARHLPTDCRKIPHSIIQVGHLLKQKRVSTTIEAFAAIRESYADATLTIVGSGPERAHLEAQCEALHISPWVRFLGQILNASVLEELAKHQFFILPSVREGFGIVYLEAMAAGCITIGTQGEGISDFIRNGENGYLVPPDSPQSIAQTVLHCLDHPEESSAAALRGQTDARNQTWEKNARAYLFLFKSL